MHTNTATFTRTINTLRSTILVGLINSVLFLTLPSIGYAQTINNVSVNPNQQTVNGLNSISASIDIAGGLNTGAFEFQLNFDPTVIQLDSITLGEYLGSTGRTTSSTGTNINNQAGTANLGFFTLGPSPAGPNDSGTLVNLLFSMTGEGTSPISITNLIVTDTTGSIQTSLATNGEITVDQNQNPTPTPTTIPNPTPTLIPDPDPNGASLWITGPDSVTRFEPFNAEVMINTQELVSGVDVIVQFNPQRLTAESITITNLMPQSPFQVINNGNGTVIFSMLTDYNQPFTGSGSLATIEFTPKIAGSTDISFDFTPGSTTDSNIISATTGQDLLQSATLHQINIVDLPPTIQVSLTTPSTNSTLGHSLTGILTHNLDPDFSLEIQIDASGQSEVIELNQSLLGATPTFTFKASTFLTKSVSTTLQPEANLLNFGALLAGDLNDDGIINTIDLGIMYDQWFTQGTADFNRDGLVNSFDHWTLLQNYLKVDE